LVCNAILDFYFNDGVAAKVSKLIIIIVYLSDKILLFYTGWSDNSSEYNYTKVVLYIERIKQLSLCQHFAE